MHLGLVVYGSLATLSGGNLYDLKLVETLRRASDRVDLISLPRSSYPRHLVHNLSSRYRNTLNRTPFDLVLQDELVHPSLFWLNRRLNGRVSYPLIGIVHHLRSSEDWPAWQRRLYAGVEAAYLRSLDAFVYNSHETRRVVESVLGDSRPGIVASPGKDRLRPQPSRDEIARRVREARTLRLLFVGNLIRRKNLHVLMAALRALPTEDWHLEIVGSPAAEPAYHRSLRRAAAQIEGRVTFLGSLADRELRLAFARSHLLVVPSSYEGFGIVYLEGMGFGVPAIAAAAGGARQMVDHGKNGFLVSPGAVDELVHSLRTLCQDRELLLAMSLAALKTYDRYATWEETTTAIRGFLKQVVAESQKRTKPPRA